MKSVFRCKSVSFGNGILFTFPKIKLSAPSCHLLECLSQFYLPWKLLRMKQICSHLFLITKKCHAYKTFKHHRHTMDVDNPFKVCLGPPEDWVASAGLQVREMVNSARDALSIPSLSLLPLVPQQMLGEHLPSPVCRAPQRCHGPTVRCWQPACHQAAWLCTSALLLTSCETMQM